MKNTKLLLAAVALITLFSCSKDDDNVEIPVDPPIDQQEPLLTQEDIQQSLNTAAPGDVILLGEGVIEILQALKFRTSGTADSPITLRGSGDRASIIDSSNSLEDAIEVIGVNYIVVENVKVQNSFYAGIRVMDADHITIQNNHVDKTWSTGIYVGGDIGVTVWCEDIKVLDNLVTHPNDRDMDPTGEARKPAHEGITISRVDGFEVARNEVSFGDKEGIDCKGGSRNGSFHDNYVHHQESHPFSVAIYIDAWFAPIFNIDIYNNIMHDCGDGVQVQSENSQNCYDVRVHHNLVYNMYWSGIGVSNYSDNDKTLRTISLL